MQKPANKPEKGILAQAGNPPIFIDLFNFAKNPEETILTIAACYRLDGIMDEKNDIQFVEHSRIAITIDHAKRAMDVLARLLNHYPKKPETPPPAKEDAPKAKK